MINKDFQNITRASRAAGVVLGISLTPLVFANSIAVQDPTLLTTKIDDSQAIEPDYSRAIDNRKQDKSIIQSGQALQETVAGDIVRSSAIDETWTTDDVYDKLIENPEAFERLLLQSLASSNVAALKTLLPAYDKFPDKDQSVVDWGNAIIMLEQRKTAEAVAAFRKVNASLPDVRLLRLQMASALYQNRQVRAAKDELQKLLRENIPEKDREEIKSYIESMNRLDKWNYSLNLSFVKDDNLENLPAVGATTQLGWAYTSPHESGTGARYYLGADKRWSYDNQLFTSFSTGVGGVYYWDNKKFNEMYTAASFGIGHQTATSEIELAPNFTKNWYGGGSSSVNTDDSLKSYYQSLGVRLSGHKWISPNVMYQHSTQLIDIGFEEPYTHNDGKVYSMYNGFLYAPNAKSYYSIGWNLSKKDMADKEDLANAYKRTGVNFSWQNTWGKGFVTNATLGIASKKHKAASFVDLYPRHNREYNLGLSVWKRDFSVFGLTPKLHLNSSQTTSNTPSEERSSVDANISLSKTF